ncbi:MAG: hypothetical protein K9L32_04725 [Chromatiaceae bacterium]|nr:hypothetical protein [Chromatiaceae bacterium]MCF8003503.1 hypothetical protein [Chromatiaceae bacterium]
MTMKWQTTQASNWTQGLFDAVASGAHDRATNSLSPLICHNGDQSSVQIKTYTETLWANIEADLTGLMATVAS